MMAQSEMSGTVSPKQEDWENEGGALSPAKSLRGDKFVTLDRTNGSKVACQLSRVDFVAVGESGAILHFGGGSQLNVGQSFEEVLALLKS